MNLKPRATRVAVMGAVVVGLAAGSYGIASAASGSSTTTVATTTTAAPKAGMPGGQHLQGGQRSDETLLTGDTEAKVKQAALAKIPGGTIDRVETDADGHALYEAHMTKSDGTRVTVYVDKDFNVVSTETGPSGPPNSGRSG